MVRKQLYIDDEHEEWLKQRALETGLTEAEIVRQAIDAQLRGERSQGMDAMRRRALAALDAQVEAIAERWIASANRTAGAGGIEWTREELYAEREDRWA